MAWLFDFALGASLCCLSLTSSSTASLPIQTVTVHGVRLQYVDWGGRGEALVFIPGVGDIAPSFTNKFHALSLTARGCGHSEHTASGYDIDTQLADTIEFLDALQIKRAILAGHSSGGSKAILLAQRYPSRVIGIICLDTAYRDVPPALDEKMGATIVESIGGDPLGSFAMMRRAREKWELGPCTSACELNMQQMFTAKKDGLAPNTAPEWRKAFSADWDAGRYAETRISVPALMIFRP
jgi:pimeloyl-ACP methyl ester carboxylesterase